MAKEAQRIDKLIVKNAQIFSGVHFLSRSLNSFSREEDRVCEIRMATLQNLVSVVKTLSSSRP